MAYTDYAEQPGYRGNADETLSNSEFHRRTFWPVKGGMAMAVTYRKIR